MTVSIIIILIIVSVFYHAGLEKRDNLGAYLGRRLGFVSNKTLGLILYSLAIFNLLTPIILSIFFPFLKIILFSYVAGGLFGDTFFTHLIPSILSKEISPANSTWKLYLPLSILLIYFTSSFSWLFLFLGVLSFVILWPALFFLKSVGVLKS